jgi:cholesterol oxidase
VTCREPERFRAVVIGSGFGGSVTAFRLAEKGWSVLVLERGRPWPPGSFPRTPPAMAHALWDPPERFGMFDVWSFTGLNAVAASGLGGGSLIYANVLMPAPESAFRHEDCTPWPVRPAELDARYADVGNVLNPVPYPKEHRCTTPKTQAMAAAAEAIGRSWESTPLAVAFSASKGDPPEIGACLPDDPDNLFGLPRSTCRLCGECDIGCNYGAKHTLDHTYLSRAHAHGAVLRTLCEVTAIAPREDGYAVTYRQHLAGRSGVAEEFLDDPDHERVTVLADRVIVAAGTMGTARLLMRNRINLPRLGGRLGHGFSSNGDLLTFAWDSEKRLDMARGPVITGTMRWDEDPPTRRMFQVQDAGVPALVQWMFHALEAPVTLAESRRARLLWLWRSFKGDRDTHIGSELAALIGEGTFSSGTLPLLGMGRDIPGGRFFLDGEDLDLSWRERDSRRFFDDLMHACRRVAGELGGEFKDVPIAHLITVHALGGCAMAKDPRSGVVNEWGESFGHPGLYVADGSVLPGPVGANPGMTIAALADRFALHMRGDAQ